MSIELVTAIEMYGYLDARDRQGARYYMSKATHDKIRRASFSYISGPGVFHDPSFITTLLGIPVEIEKTLPDGVILLQGRNAQCIISRHVSSNTTHVDSYSSPSAGIFAQAWRRLKKVIRR